MIPEYDRSSFQQKVVPTRIRGEGNGKEAELVLEKELSMTDRAIPCP